ncbi:hypothetical protein M407DRAFT_213261 [Tulasnella calospora MUT 4182]|uniref:Metallo-beta-lactamase domain-containing protein n=1 Tax=Tulasnella calospora MUT 4182 TaxID=1051891 RepID=A0A0C3KRR6_9AGAM|nr:hypothetical protein M407DRAFT_213261 [Tulasnella calospora MUT 4182]
MKATWLGHACFLLELPPPDGAARGARILFDPVFSHRCFPFTFIGPARHTPPPCKLEELPSVDIAVISHNHYDHLNTHNITTLDKLFRPHFFAPLNNGAYFKSNNVPEERTHILDWWDARNVTRLDGSVHTLWASWAIRDPASGKKAWFDGDTGYRTVHPGENEDELPVCPEFKNIGEKFGGFDLAFIPIGAYNIREVTSCVHCAPQDSVRIFKDVRAKKAIGTHWYAISSQCEKLGISKDEFDICGLGETVFT